MLLQQVLKVQDGGLTGNPREADTRATVNPFVLIRRFPHRRITQLVDHLHDLNPQYAR